MLSRRIMLHIALVPGQRFNTLHDVYCYSYCQYLLFYLKKIRRIHCFSFQCHDVNQIKRLYFFVHCVHFKYLDKQTGRGPFPFLYEYK